MYLNNKAEDISKWKKTVTKTEKDGNIYISAIYTDPSDSLLATLSATLFQDSPTVDFTDSLKNTSDKNSPIISKLYGMDTLFHFRSKEIISL